MYNRLYSYIEKLNVLSLFQHGFRHGHSTAMSLINLEDSVSTAIDNKEFSLGVFIDITKAFDTVNHSILLYKMGRLGVRGLALSWFGSYLSERYQQVYCKGSSIFDVHKIGFLIPLSLSTCVHMGGTPSPCGRPHAVDMKYTPLS